MAVKPKLYPQKRNDYGSYDPTSLSCFATIGALSEGQLAGHDKAHICDSAFLAERGTLTQGEFVVRLASSLPGAQSYPRTHKAA